MAIMYNKGTEYKLLKESYKVPQNMLDTLKQLGISLKVGDTVIALDNGKGLVKEHSFNTLVGNTVKNPTPMHVVEVNAFVGNYINLASGASAAAIPAAPKAAKKSVNISQDEVNKLPVVKLRDAAAMYQRVHGTSSGSVYRVVAMNDEIKVAVRVSGNSVSVRIEGVIKAKTEQAFSNLGIQKKSEEYMSGHFSCEKCTPHKLIGSILTGSGIEFNTPLPVVSKVME
jgi:hypothetical protein